MILHRLQENITTVTAPINVVSLDGLSEQRG
jgi:hypothetical protein